MRRSPSTNLSPCIGLRTDVEPHGLDKGTLVHVGLKAQQIIGAQVAQPIAMRRHRAQNVERRKRRVQKKSDRPLESACPHLGRHRHEMIVVHPEGIARLQQFHQMFGEPGIHPPVAFVVAATVMQECEPIMHQRPQDAIGETLVVLVVIARAERQGDVFHAVALHAPRRFRPMGKPASIPTEPDAALRAERGAQSNSEPTRGRPIGARHGDAIRNHHQSTRAGCSHRFSVFRNALNGSRHP